MTYFKAIENGYIICVGIGSMGLAISAEEYAIIGNAVRNKPNNAPQGYKYRLRADTLEWELTETQVVYELSPDDDELTDSKALDIITGDEEAVAEDYEEALGRFGV